MDKYTYKERDRALFVEKVGFISYHKKTDMLILFKYYKSLDLPKKEAKAKVVDILKKSSSDFDIDDYKEVLDRTANMVYSKNKKLIQIDKIQIETLEEVLNLEDGTKVWVEDNRKNFNNCKCVYQKSFLHLKTSKFFLCLISSREAPQCGQRKTISFLGLELIKKVCLQTLQRNCPLPPLLS